jgi:hypothetical protein
VISLTDRTGVRFAQRCGSLGSNPLQESCDDRFNSRNLRFSSNAWRGTVTRAAPLAVILMECLWASPLPAVQVAASDRTEALSI